MYGRNEHSVALFRKHLPDALLHFVGGLVGKGDRQNFIRPDMTLLDQMRDPHRQHARLAAAGPRDNPDILARRQHGLFLIFIQHLN